MIGHRVPLDTGVELNYVDEGAGRPVVFIPGWMASVEFFRYQLPHIAETHRAISYDPRSQGDSSRLATGHNFTQRGKDLHALLDALKLPKVVLVGWSYGSYDAYAYLRDFGTDRVAAVVGRRPAAEELGHRRGHDELVGIPTAAGRPARLPARHPR